jgi:hypothetical protein
MWWAVFHHRVLNKIKDPKVMKRIYLLLVLAIIFIIGSPMLYSFNLIPIFFAFTGGLVGIFLLLYMMFYATRESRRMAKSGNAK